MAKGARNERLPLRKVRESLLPVLWRKGEVKMEVGNSYYHGPGISTMCAVEHALHTLFLRDAERILVINEVRKDLPNVSDYYLYKISYKIENAFLHKSFPVTMNVNVRSAWKDLNDYAGMLIRERAEKRGVIKNVFDRQ